MNFFSKLTFLVLISGVLIGSFYYFSTKTPRRCTYDSSALYVGTAAEFPPFEFVKDGTIVGFDIDLINAVAQKLDKKVILSDMPFLTLIPQAQRGSLQIIAAGLTPTPEREQVLLFSDPYLISDPLVVVSLAKNKPITSLDDLHGKTVLVNEGFSAERYMASISGVDLKRLPTVADAFLSLSSGRADAFVVAANTVKPFFKQYARSDFSVYTIPDTNEKTAFAVSKKFPELKDQINKALELLRDEGFIESLKKKWDII